MIFPAYKASQVIYTDLLGKWGGMCLFFVILIHPKCKSDKRLLNHELVHFRQQQAWWRWAGPLGILAWWALYLGCLPVGWNCLRYNAEMEAYTDVNAQCYGVEYVRKILYNSYKLWWM